MRSLSIIIPAYNEEQRLPAAMYSVLQYLHARTYDFCEVLVVDDGSKDGTAAVVEKFRKTHPVVKLVSNPGNRGKGFAVRHGMQVSRGDWVLFTDADLSSPIEELDKLWAAVEKSKADGAIGSRALDRKLVGVHQPKLREFSGRIFNLCMRIVTGLPFKDTQCGFKLFSRRLTDIVKERQQLDGFGFDVELLFIARQHKFNVLEVPVRWNNAEGTKVSLLSGITAFADPLRIRRNGFRGLYR